MSRVLEERPAPAWFAWLDRMVVPRNVHHSLRPAVGIIAGLGLCYALTAALGSNRVVSTTWYIPVILFGAARFRYAGGLLTAFTATILSGPLREGSVAANPPILWIGRGVVFTIVGVVTSGLIERIVASKQRELELAEQERDLAIRQAAVIATVSHEFRTPLTVISGVARTLEMHDMVSPDGIPLLEGLGSASRRLTDLVNTIGAVLDGTESDTFVRRETVLLRDVLTHVLLTSAARDPKSRIAFDVRPEAEIFVSDRELCTSTASTRHRERPQVLAVGSGCRGTVHSNRRQAANDRAGSRTGDQQRDPCLR